MSITFDLRGVAFAAWTLVAFAIGALAGILIRRVVPAMFATLAAWSGLAVVTGVYLRRHYETPLVTSGPNLPSAAWVISQSVDPGRQAGQLLRRQPGSAEDRRSDSRARPVRPVPGPGAQKRAWPTPASTESRAIPPPPRIYQLPSYQPASRFWPFQWIEGGWLLALSLLLMAATVWLVRRRAA